MMLAMLTCPKCGVEVPPDTPVENCPNCLLSFALGDTQTILHADSDEPLPALFTGRKFGDYQLLEEIARGGMGIVYKARQVSLDRIVAVKMILAGAAASKEFIHRFRTEAAAAANLQHPNIVAVHEVGAHQGENYLVMDFVDGPNLAHFVGQHPLSAPRAARYVNLIAEAIHYAHERGILHRDLKPSNVLIDSAIDQPRLTDFGLAKRFGPDSQLSTQDSQLTLTGQVLGSPNFMAPEQATGTKGKVSRRTDVYGLGAILYHLLTARPPFQAESLPETLQQVANAEPLSPRLLNPSVPSDLETICLKCLEKEPEKRYPTSQALADDLARFLNYEPIHARPVTRIERAWRWCRRKPLVASLSSATFLLLLAVAIGSPVAAFRINRAAMALRRNLYVADISNASEAIQRRQFGQAREILERHRPRFSEEEDLRGIEWRFLWQQCQPNDEFAFAGHSNDVTCAELSLDVAWLATASEDRTIQVWDFKARERIRTLTGFDGFIDTKALAFTPDGRWLVAKGGNLLRAWRVGDWREVGPPLAGEPNWNGNNAVAISRDGKTLATRLPGGVGFVDLSAWKTNGMLLADTNRRHGAQSLGTVLKYSPDGRWLVVSDWHELLIRDAHDPRRAITNLLRADRNLEMRIKAVSFSQNLLAAAFRDGVVTLWDVNDWREIISFQAQLGGLYDLALSPDATLLVTCGEEHAIQIWQVPELLQTHARRGFTVVPSLLRGHSRLVHSVQFMADGRRLLSSSADRTTRIWDVSLAQRQEVLPATQSPIWFSADGAQMLIAHTNGAVHRWDVAKRLDLGPVEPGIDAGPVRAVSPEGQLAVVAPGMGKIELRDLRTGQVFREYDIGGEKMLRARFATKSPLRRLAMATVEKSAVVYWLWDVDSSPRPVRVGISSGVTPDMPIAVFALSQDGRFFAYGNTEDGIQWTNLANRASGRIFTDGENLGSLAIQGNGALLAASGYGNYRVRFWEVSSGRELPSLALADRGSEGTEFSADGKTLITCNWDGDLRFWNVALRRQLMVAPSYNPMQLILLLSPDGSSLAFPVPSSQSWRGKVRLWHGPPLAEIDAIERAKPRSNPAIAAKEAK